MYPVGGTTDSGMVLAPVAHTVNSQFGSPWNKRCQFAYFGSPDDVRVTPCVDGRDYTRRTTRHGRSGERVANLPAGLVGTNWSFKIEPQTGHVLKLNNFTPRLDVARVHLGR